MLQNRYGDGVSGDFGKAEAGTKELFQRIADHPACLISARVSKLFVPAQHKPFSGLALDIVVLEPCLGVFAQACPPVEYSSPAGSLMSTENASLRIDGFSQMHATGMW